MDTLNAAHSLPINTQSNTPMRSIFWAFLLFWFLTGVTQLLLAVYGAASFEGFKDSTITTLFWLLPIIAFSQYAKKVSAGLAFIIWLAALPGVGYFLIYKQDLTQSLMFIIFESNQAESTEFFQHYFSWAIVLGYLVFSYIAFKLWQQIKPFYITKNTTLIMSAVLLALVLFSPVKRAVARHEVKPAFNSMSRHLAVSPPWQLSLGYLSYQKELKTIEQNLLNMGSIPPLTHLTETKKPQPTTVVLVIGESTNRLHMGLYGYARDTNPKLNRIKNELHVFNNVFAPRPNTIESLEQVLTFANQHHPDLYKTKASLIALMKQAGYKTYWVTNQQTLTTRNTMLTTFAKQADKQVFLNHARSQNAYSFDEKVLAPYAEILKSKDEKKLIVVHLIGTHMKYAFRYPQSYAYFNGLVAGLPQDKSDVINAYDNAVRYNDMVVYELITHLKNMGQHSALFYFSDHGDDVYDSKTHAFNGRNEANPTYPMYAVPFIIWTSQNWITKDKLNTPNMLVRQYDNGDFIHTFSDVVGLNYDGFLPHESLVSPDFVEDAIMVGDPYGKKLQVLAGTKPVADHHAAE